MKLTCCTWNCLLELGAHSRHITQIGIYFILRNNCHIDIPWNISKIFYWIYFFVCSTHGFDIELHDILYSILCKLYILRIGVLDWYKHCADCAGVCDEIIKIVGHSLDFHLGTCTCFDEVENVSAGFFLLLFCCCCFFTNTGFCSEILKSALFPSLERSIHLFV